MASTFAVTGSSGFVGSALVSDLRAAGHRVVRLVRAGGPATDTALWNPETGAIAVAAVPAIDCVVHLAGASVVAGRWAAAQKQLLHDSRVCATANLCRALAALPQKPAAMIAASATGFYGNRGDEVLDERSPSGSGFLAALCRDWEAATAPATAAGIRVVSLRIGLVLGHGGGVLQRLLLPFKLGLGGPLGNGRQFMSTIALADLLAAIRFCAEHTAMAGAVNAVGPAPVTNREFTRALGRALRRPAFLPLPAFALRLLFGEMANELFLAGQRVLPRRLQAEGFTFRCPDLVSTLAAALAPP